jgi:hypothetical protein
MSLPGLRLQLYPEGLILTVEPLYRQATALPIGRFAFRIHTWRMQTDLGSLTIPNGSGQVDSNEAYNAGFSRSRIRARLAVSVSVRVPHLYLHFPRGFRQFLAHGPLPARFDLEP